MAATATTNLTDMAATISKMIMAVTLLQVIYCHQWRAARMKKVAVIVQDGVESFGLGVFAEVWDEPYHEDDDLIAVVAKRNWDEPSPEVAAALRRADARGAQILASCTATFILGEAGLFDGRTCTTHWRYGKALQEAFPLANVNAGVLYVDDGNILTGAGSAGNIDACLHLMRRVFGAKTAAARRIVVPPYRNGGQLQYVRTPLGQTEADTLAPLLQWASGRLENVVDGHITWEVSLVTWQFAEASW